jgi:hypothetical protein
MHIANFPGDRAELANQYPLHEIHILRLGERRLLRLTRANWMSLRSTDVLVIDFKNDLNNPLDAFYNSEGEGD